MTRHKIVLKRNALGIISNNTIGTDAFNAVSSIPNITDAHIESEDDIQVEISYIYTSNEKFWGTNEHLAKFGLERADWL